MKFRWWPLSVAANGVALFALPTLIGWAIFRWVTDPWVKAGQEMTKDWRWQ